MPVVKASQVVLTVSEGYSATRPALPSGEYRIWPNSPGNPFTHPYLVWKEKDWGGTSREAAKTTEYTITIDGQTRSDVGVYAKVQSYGGLGWITGWWYQNLDLIPADGCDVVITKAFSGFNPSWYNMGSKLARAFAFIGTKDVGQELVSVEVTNLAEGVWQDYSADMYQFLPAGTYALGFAFHTEGISAPYVTGTAVLKGGYFEFRYFHVKLTLSADKTSASRGETVTFTGNLTKKDAAVGGSTVTLKAKDPSGTETTLGTGTTNVNGFYTIKWTIPSDAMVGKWTIWAEATIAASPQQVKIRSRPISFGMGVPTFSWKYVAIGAAVIIAGGTALYLVSRKRR